MYLTLVQIYWKHFSSVALCVRPAWLNFKISLNSAASESIVCTVCSFFHHTHETHAHTAHACMDECQRLHVRWGGGGGACQQILSVTNGRKGHIHTAVTWCPVSLHSCCQVSHILSRVCDLPAVLSDYQHTQQLKPLIKLFMFTFYFSKNRIEAYALRPQSIDTE